MSNLKLPRIKTVNYNGNLNKADLEVDDDNFKITYIKSVRTKNTQTILAECSLGLFHKMMNSKKIFIGWERYPIYEDLKVPQCYKCQYFTLRAQYATTKGV